MSENRDNVQSSASVPTREDQRTRSCACSFCHAVRYVKTSDNFSIEELFSREELEGTTWPSRPCPNPTCPSHNNQTATNSLPRPPAAS